MTLQTKYRLWTYLESSWGCFGASWDVLGRPGGVSEAPWHLLGASLGGLGASWGRLEGVLVPSWERLQDALGSSWEHVAGFMSQDGGQLGWTFDENSMFLYIQKCIWNRSFEIGVNLFWNFLKFSAEPWKKKKMAQISPKKEYLNSPKRKSKNLQANLHHH